MNAAVGSVPCSSTIDLRARSPTTTAASRLSNTQRNEFRGVIDVGLGPFCTGWIGAMVARKASHVVADEVRVVVRHELEVARPACGHHRFAERHCLRYCQPKSLAAVQGCVAVAREHHTATLFSRDITVDDDNVTSAGRRSAQKFELLQASLPVDALEHERCAIVRPEPTTKGINQAEGVLALDAAEEIEHEEEQEPIR